jgi:sugar/nucleoside kinase (ribokinase family)
MRDRVWDLVIVGGVAAVGPRRFARGASAALAAARLGARVAMIGRAPGGPTGRALLESLATSGVGTRHLVETPPETREADANPSAPLALAEVESAQGTLGNARVLLLEVEAGPAALVRSSQLARQGNPHSAVVLDAAHGAVELPPELVVHADVLVLGNAAARNLTGRAPADVLSARRLADRFFEQGAQTVALQIQPGHGAAGIGGADGRPAGSQHLLVWPEAERWLPPLDMPSMADLDPGAVFASWLAVAMGRGQPIDELPEGMEISARWSDTPL